MGARRPSLSIVVPTLDTPRLTRACLESVVKHTSVPYELIVVSNSRARGIRDCLGSFRGIQVVQNPRNLGFSRAANQGALAASGDHVCWLNSDVLVPPRWAERLIQAARAPGVGAAGPLAPGFGCEPAWTLKSSPAIGEASRLVDEAMEGWYPAGVEDVHLLFGFCLLVRRSVLSRVGLFDQRFFFGHEDVDYSLRLRLQGYRLVRLRSLYVHHQGAGSVGAPRRERLFRQAEELFLEKWGAILGGRYSRLWQVCEEVNRRCARGAGAARGGRRLGRPGRSSPSGTPGPA